MCVVLPAQECNLAGKPVFVTRVVDTMTEAPRPTRAEATGTVSHVLHCCCDQTIVFDNLITQATALKLAHAVFITVIPYAHCIHTAVNAVATF